jgi:hypothetical protein
MYHELLVVGPLSLRGLCASCKRDVIFSSPGDGVVGLSDKQAGFLEVRIGRNAKLKRIDGMR